MPPHLKTLDQLSVAVFSARLFLSWLHVLPLLINPSQGAFIKGRRIVDNIILSHEIIRGYSRARNSSRMLLKIDLNKAFDSVSWGVLRE